MGAASVLLSMALAAGAPAPQPPCWRTAVAPGHKKYLIASAAFAGPSTLIVATWPYEEVGGDKRDASVWLINIRDGSRHKLLEGVTAWGVAPAQPEGFWLLPRMGGELVRYSLSGRKVEKRRLPIRAHQVISMGGKLILVQFAFGAHGALLWKSDGAHFKPWAGKILNGSDMASTMRLNLVTVAADSQHAAFARPFVGPEVTVLNAEGKVKSKFRLPDLDEASPTPANSKEPAYPVRSLAITRDSIYALVGRRGTEIKQRHLLKLDLQSGRVLKKLPAMPGALVVGPDNGVFLVDEALGVHQLVAKGGSQ